MCSYRRKRAGLSKNRRWSGRIRYSSQHPHSTSITRGTPDHTNQSVVMHEYTLYFFLLHKICTLLNGAYGFNISARLRKKNVFYSVFFAFSHAKEEPAREYYHKKAVCTSSSLYLRYFCLFFAFLLVFCCCFFCRSQTATVQRARPAT